MTRHPIAHIPINMAGHANPASSDRDTHYRKAYSWES